MNFRKIAIEGLTALVLAASISGCEPAPDYYTKQQYEAVQTPVPKVPDKAKIRGKIVGSNEIEIGYHKEIDPGYKQGCYDMKFLQITVQSPTSGRHVFLYSGKLYSDAVNAEIIYSPLPGSITSQELISKYKPSYFKVETNEKINAEGIIDDLVLTNN